MTHSGVLFVARANFQQFNLSNDSVKMVLCVSWLPTFLELATTLKHLGAKWLPGKKVNFTPWKGTMKFPITGGRLKVVNYRNKLLQCPN